MNFSSNAGPSQC